jgi:hypothetical protein
VAVELEQHLEDLIFSALAVLEVAVIVAQIAGQAVVVVQLYVDQVLT